MAAGTSTDVRASQIQAIHKAAPKLFALEDGPVNKIMKGGAEKVTVSGLAMRLPYEIRPGGLYGAFDPAGGTLGAGNNFLLGEATSSPIARKLGVEMQKAQIWDTDDPEKAFINALKKGTKDASMMLADCMNREFMTDGDCILCTVSAGETTTTLTVDTTRLLRVGLAVSSYSNNMATKRAENTLVTKIISQTQFMVETAFTAQSSTDRITIEQPSTAPANPVGLFGPRYFITSNSALYWHDVLRSDVPGLVSPYVDGSGNALTPAMARLLMNKLKIHRGENVFQNSRYSFLFPLAQAQAWEDLGINISEISGNGNFSNQGVDRLFNEKKSTVGGLPIDTSIVANPARVDLIDYADWFRAEKKPIGLYDVDGTTIFEGRDGDGNVKTTQNFWLTFIGQLHVSDPGRHAYIDDLAKPSASYGT